MYHEHSKKITKGTTYVCTCFYEQISLIQEKLQQVSNISALRNVGMEDKSKRLTLYNFGHF